ncbi:general secretion pathway protein GspB [Massilia rhizosphaerae]|uniref:general secretion pathway protein GspB n=1 Tax=Massilia rhizosphaerae TaxID=2784389 RepID=UPI0018DE6240|nr:general secretion pathway protein GspB [Massilia rhizosphaerae]
MSYILEALKKAQAERQLGSAPTIHAPQAVPTAPAGMAANRRPLLVGLGAGAAVVAAGALFMWRQAPVPVPAPAPEQPAPQTLAITAPPAPPPAPERAPEPVHARVAARQAPPRPVPAAPAAPAPAASAPAAPAPVTAKSAPEDSLPFLQQLPEARRRDIPHVTFGGYMYSSNPSDRLLIVDKALRHEGEEVAPGLVLEKLLPKAAVMNYRGTRFRVPY